MALKWEEMISYGSSDFYYYLVFGLSNLAYLFNTYVEYRQYKVYKTQKKAPKEVASLCTPEEYEKSRVYGFDKARFGLKVGFIGQVQTNAFLYFGALPWLWNWSAEWIKTRLGSSHLTEIKQSMVFVAANIIVSTVLDLPFSYYSTFFIEQKHGFNKQTFGLWAKDKIKSVVLSLLFGCPIVAALIWTIKWGGDNFYLAVWVLLSAVQFLMILIFPTFIQPLFNKFEALPDGDLKKAIQALAVRLKFPLTKIYVMDGSTRSSHSNAYFFGLFKDKRIVLFDTLINQMDKEEICAVLGHELGHWSCSHMAKRLLIVQVHLFTLFYLFSKVIGEKALYSAFGFNKTLPVIVGLMLFQYLLTPIEMAIGLLMTCQSRSHEFEADRFAHGLGFGKLLQGALIKLHAKNAALVPPDSLYSTMHYSHPPLPERLAAIQKLDQSTKKTK